jgi:protein-tyrosine phosphatase
VIDLHCHILPAVDDGPATADGTLEMARAHVAAGVQRVLATPHVTWDIPTSSATVEAKTAEVNALLRDHEIPLEVLTGGEIALTRVSDLDDDELRALALGGGPWLLVESPLTPSAAGFDTVLHHLQARGHRVMLAHPERCPAFQREPERLASLVHAGMLTSITAGALIGRFGGTVERYAHELVRDGLVHNVASDAHDASRRPPGMRGEVEAAGYGAAVSYWCEEVPAAVVAGEDVPQPPPAPLPDRQRRPRKRGLLRGAWSRR